MRHFLASSVSIGLAVSFLHAASACAGDGSSCDLSSCFSKQQEAVRERVLKGETVMLTENVPGSPYRKQLAYKRVRGADPELLAGMFASHEELKKHITAMTRADVVRRSGSAVTMSYELDVARLLGPDAGALAGKAPISRYAVTNRFSRPGESYLVSWEIDAHETTKLNPKKGLFGGLTGNMGEPEHVSGFFLVEPLPGTPDSVITYANYVAPKSALARPMAGTVNDTATKAVRATIERVATWAEGLVASSGALPGRFAIVSANCCCFRRAAELSFDP